MKIAIAGYGIEGESNYRYWSSNPDNIVTIVDQKQPDINIPKDANAVIGENVFEELHDFDMVVRTAGLAPRKIKTNGKIWSATNEFFAKCPAEIIGVTGTKGKGTTASIIASILEAAGKRIWVLGNIGKPALDILNQIKPSDIVVYELSSFQLWDIEKSPQIAVLLLIEQEHLNVHDDMPDYIAAKANITKYQTNSDLLIYNRSNEYATEIANSSKAQITGFIDEKTAHIENDSFFYGEQNICSIDALQLVGKYHYENACAAIDAVWGIVNDKNAIERGLRGFKGLPHRLQFVREVHGVKYYDDSIATTPSSAIADLRTFDVPKVIILGGSSKGADFTNLANELNNHEVKAILVGDEAKKIADACKRADFNDFQILKDVTMAEIVKKAGLLAMPGSVVLLSPAAASFGMFKNYSDRGEQYISAVKKL